MLNPVAMSIIRNVVRGSARAGQAIGVWGAVVGISMALGPVARRLARRRAELAGRVPGQHPDRPGRDRAHGALRARVARAAPAASRSDRPGAGASSCSRRLTSAIIEGPRLGWTSPAILAARRHRGVALAALVRYELRRRDPLIDPRFFASRPFSAASVIAVAAFAAFGGFLFLNTLYLQDVRDLSPLSAGLCMLPMAAHDRVGQPALRPRRRDARGARPAGHRRSRARHRQPDARPARAPTPRSDGCCSRTASSGSGSAPSTRRSRTPPFPACRRARPAWPPPWPRRAARSA